MLRGGNTTHIWFRTQRGRASWAADTRHDACDGIRLYELNLWIWRYCRGQAFLDDL